ncbi:MAG TPA: wax ester/triacylglycerol synthase family O-acyltransferase [Acidimicrobiia bacterium]
MSGTDSLFLAAETPTWHQHVGGLTIVDPSSAPGFCFDSLVRTVGERLPLIPKLTWRLKPVPLGLDRAVWVDDTEFDLRRHLHHATVRAPGGPREAAAAVAPILSRQLDRRYPLWELWYFDGLVGGHVGILMKFHHCLLDGGAGSVLATLLLDTEPSPPLPEVPPAPVSEPEPSDLRLLLDGLLPTATAPLRALRYGVRLTRRSVELGRHVLSGRATPDLGAMLAAPKTSFNAPIGPRRAMAFSSVALADVKALRRHYGVKVNDIALALCSGALRTYLLERDELPSRSLTAGIPVSIRSAGDTALDNQLSYLAVPIATDVADPEARLHEIVRHTRAAKDVHDVLRATPVGSLADTAPPLVLGALLRLAYETHVLSYVPGMMNTIVSNVPGPPMTLYLAGARLTGIFSASVLLDQMGLNMTLFTFGDRVDFGLHVDPDLVADPWAVADAIPAALAEMMVAAGLGAPSPVEDAFGIASGVEPGVEPGAEIGVEPDADLGAGVVDDLTAADAPDPVQPQPQPR